MLEGKNDKDIADEVPELVKKISAYIYDNQPKKKKFSIESILNNNNDKNKDEF
jgi:hypothetical protein